jgi:hypothetical protein
VIKKYQKGNAGTHQREGQNVLFMDSHVYFENQSFCGVDEDNIYTYQPVSASAPAIQEGVKTSCATTYDPLIPELPRDSFLVNECGGTPSATATTTTGFP